MSQLTFLYHVIKKQSSHYFFQNLIRDLGINFDFQNNFVCWKETNIPMKSIHCKLGTNFAIQESILKVQLNRIKKILDAIYKR